MRTLILILLLETGASLAFASNLIMEQGPKIKSPLGYALTYPAGYSGLRDERDNGMETAILWPKGSKPELQDIGDPVKIRKLHLVVIDVMPFSMLTHPNLNDFAKGCASKLKASGQNFVSRKISVPLGKGVVFETTSEPKQVLEGIMGKKLAFQLKAGWNDVALKTTADSLREIPADASYPKTRAAVEEFTRKLDGPK
jgi:hypothetical protein